jgi:hypothetical protein
MIGPLQVPNMDFLTYEFEIQKLKEEIERLTKELELAQKVCFNTFTRVTS